MDIEIYSKKAIEIVNYRIKILAKTINLIKRLDNFKTIEEIAGRWYYRTEDCLEKYLNRDEVLRYEENVGSFFGYKTKEEIIDCLKNCRKFLKKIIRDLELLPEDMLILRYDKEKILDIEIPKN